MEWLGCIRSAHTYDVIGVRHSISSRSARQLGQLIDPCLGRRAEWSN